MRFFNKDKNLKGSISVEEKLKAKKKILFIMQQEQYYGEIKALSENKQIKG